MRIYGILIISCFLLFGCSITVDEEQSSEPQKPTTFDNDTPVPLPVNATPVPEESASFVDLIENIFHLNWSEKQLTNANDISYLALGDSLTRGVGDEVNREGFTKRLSEQIELWPTVNEVDLDNRGKRGRRSDQLLALLEKGHYDKELAAADFITITIGGNDVMKVVKTDLFALKQEMFDVELANFTQNYDRIVEEIRQRNEDAPLILIGFYNPFSIVIDEVTPFESIIDEWNGEIEKYAVADVNACFVPVNDLFTSNDDMVYHTDFFHPNSKGYDRMTTRIIETMKSCDIEAMSDGLIGFEE